MLAMNDDAVSLPCAAANLDINRRSPGPYALSPRNIPCVKSSTTAQYSNPASRAHCRCLFRPECRNVMSDRDDIFIRQ